MSFTLIEQAPARLNRSELAVPGSSPQLSFTDLCGQTSSTADGVAQPLSATLTVTDSAGNSATASAGSGSQPALAVRLFTCGV